jgi:Rrf2 family transcriptional regulator, nitric oxide-sensitive transcriptional repressor
LQFFIGWECAQLICVCAPPYGEQISSPGSDMRLTSYSDYTLRMLMYLAINADRITTIAEIAKAYHISETHLMKVAHQLGVAGDIETIRGRNGGIRLVKPLAAINLGRIVRRTEADMELVPCFADTELCAIGKACILQGVLQDALDAFLAVLDQYTLADLVRPRRKLASLLREGTPRSVGAASRPSVAS